MHKPKSHSLIIIFVFCVAMLSAQSKFYKIRQNINGGNARQQVIAFQKQGLQTAQHMKVNFCK